MTNPIKRLLMRSTSLRAARTLPSIVGGFRYAQSWPESDVPPAEPAEISSIAQANPLRTYFDSLKEGRGVWKWAHYFDIYHRYFHKFVGKKVGVLEVGIYSGGSLEMWKKYFGPDSTIYGVDREPACKVYETEQTRIFIGDQADRIFWRRFKSEVPLLDIVIDDGGHLPEQQIVTLEEILSHIRTGGVYLCEDVHGTHNRFAAYVHGLTTALNADSTDQPRGDEQEHSVVAASPFQRAVYAVHHYPFMVVIEKSSFPAARLLSQKRGSVWQPFLK